MIQTIFKSVLVCFFAVQLVACSGNDAYTISKNRVGLVTNETTVEEVDALFENDSIVKNLSEGVLGYKGSYTQADDYYYIYSKEGKHLLTLTPKEPLDSLSTFKVIEIHDELYTTEEGIGLGSTFEEINLLTNISKTESTFTKVVLYLDALNATMTLDKLDLGITTIQTNDVQLEQIPNLVKPTSFVVWFD
ncbi:hypothetical protein [Flavicella marina]|uniref:hypothetical protein n=1 Tax=Flavicella marina TaxID=1475951 RepID=UPI001264E20D|nr:hypothetical protein [Flavicella marina]